MDDRTQRYLDHISKETYDKDSRRKMAKEVDRGADMREREQWFIDKITKTTKHPLSGNQVEKLQQAHEFTKGGVSEKSTEWNNKLVAKKDKELDDRLQAGIRRGDIKPADMTKAENRNMEDVMKRHGLK